MSKADPKHGRWILPLVIVGLIGFTYLFVNALPPGPGGETDSTLAADGSIGGAASTTAAGDGSAATSTTVSIDPAVRAFNVTLDGFIETTQQLSDDAQSINDDWDDKTVNYANTQELLGGLITSTDELVAEVEQFEPPSAANEAWVSVLGITPELQTHAAGMLDGLINSEGSEARLTALESFKTAAADLIAAFEEARTAVGG